MDILAQVSSETVPGNIEIPLWLLITTIVALAGAVGALFRFLMASSSKQVDILKESYESQISLLKQQIKDKSDECLKLEEKLDERYKQMSKQIEEMSKVVDMGQLLIRQMRPGLSETSLETRDTLTNFNLGD